MTDPTIELTRRKILLGAGTVGVAGIGAGFGTSALFSDEESFTNNSIAAGKLDLKVDWEEHYSYPQIYGFDDPAAGLDVTTTEPDTPSEYVGLPTPDDPIVWVHEGDLGEYMDGTTIESYPDSDDNRVQDDLAGYDACADFADTPEDLDPTMGLRTENADTMSDGSPAPLVNLQDVKPGDFGELTLSFHLCDNPGYVWLQGELVEARENGRTEPEESASGETGNPGDVATSLDDPAADDIELLDAIQTCLWYDEDGDNVYEPGVDEEQVDLAVVFDQSESMNSGPDSGNNDVNPEKLGSAVSGAKSLVDTTGGTTNLGLVFFSDTAATGVKRELGSSRADIKQDLDDLDGPDDPTNPLVDDNQAGVDSGDGNSGQTDTDGDGEDDDNLILDTDIYTGIVEAEDELINGTNARSGARKIMVLLSDGNPWDAAGDARVAAIDAKDNGVEIFTIAYGSDANQSLMEDIASSPTDTHAFDSAGPSDIESIFGQIGQIIGGEEKFFEGSLRDLLGELESGAGIPLDGNRDTLFDELSDPDDDPDRDEFVDSTNNFLGLAWWLPRSAGNETQSDSVSFDLGFYTVQSRNNDGGT